MQKRKALNMPIDLKNLFKVIISQITKKIYKEKRNMGRLLLGKKEEYGLNKGVKQAVLSNGIWVTMDFQDDNYLLTACLAQTAIKYGFSYKNLNRTVTDENGLIKSIEFDEEELQDTLNKNLTLKVAIMLKILDLDIHTANQNEIRMALEFIEAEYRNDIRLLWFHMTKELQMKKIADYYQLHRKN